MDRPALTLCLLVLALTFPGPQPLPRQPARRRRRHRLVLAGAARDPRPVRLRDAQPPLLRARRAARLGAGRRRCCSGSRPGSAEYDRARARRRRRTRAARRVVVGASALGVKVARALAGGRQPRRRLRRLLRRPHRRPHRPRGQGPACWARSPTSPPTPVTHGVREVYITLPLGSQPRIVDAARAAAGHDRVALLRARRVRHQHHPGPAAGHERRSRGRHLRDAVHRHQRAGQAGERPRARHADPGADLAAAAGHRDRRQAQLARAGDLQAAPQRPRRRRDRGLQVPLDDDARTTAPVVRQATRNDPRVTPFGAFLRRNLARRAAAVLQRAAGHA